MSITIRLACPEDAPDMAEIISRSWEAAYQKIIPMDLIQAKNASRLDLFRRIITAENDSQYVITSNGTTVGIMGVAPPDKREKEIDDSFYELQSLYLHPAFCHRGIGTAAMNFALEKGRAAGRSRMILWVFAENTGAIRFYEACGFAPDGAEKIYNCGKDLRSIRMQRKI